MNTKFDEQQIADVFADQARELGFDDTPFPLIVTRARTRHRRRNLLRSVAAVAVLGGASVATVRLLGPNTDQLAVTANTATAPASGSTTAVPTSVAPSTSASAPAVEPTPIDSAVPVGETTPDPTASKVVANQDLVRGTPVAYREGFLLTDGEIHGDESAAATSTISFQFTSDGTNFESAGELEVIGDWGRPAIDGDTVIVASIAMGQRHELHLYRSDDLTNWQEDVVDLDASGPIPELTPKIRELVDIGVYMRPHGRFGSGGGLATNDQRWVAPIDIDIFPSLELRRAHNVPDGADAQLSRAGLTIIDENQNTVIPPSELGVSEDDLASYSRALELAGSLAWSGTWGSDDTFVVEAGGAPWRDVVPIGDGFAGLAESGRILRSDDGRTWKTLPVDLDPYKQQLLGLLPLDQDVLAVTTDGERTETYRVTADGTKTLLGEVPLESGYQLVERISGEPGAGVFDAWAEMPDTIPPGDITLVTDDYQVTLVDDTGENNAGDDASVHYVIRDKASGDIVAENTREYGSWQEGELIDGVDTVTFTDADDRPDVLIPLAEFEDAIAQFYATLDSANSVAAEATDEVDSGDSLVQLATGDGVHWYQNADSPESSIEAVNGTKVLLRHTSGEANRFEVIEIGGTPPQS